MVLTYFNQSLVAFSGSNMHFSLGLGLNLVCETGGMRINVLNSHNLNKCNKSVINVTAIGKVV